MSRAVDSDEHKYAGRWNLSTYRFKVSVSFSNNMESEHLLRVIFGGKSLFSFHQGIGNCILLLSYAKNKH